MQVLQYIEDTIAFSAKEAIPVFRLQDLMSMYKNQMLKYVALQKDAERVHSTRLKLKLLEHVPGLCEAKDGRNVLFTLDRAVFEACNKNKHNDRIIITKAAHILRKQLLLNK